MNKDYKEFTEEVREGVEAATQKTVKLQTVKKNNGVVLVGVTIFTEGNTMAPTIYLESFYEDYKDGKSIDEIICAVILEHDRTDIAGSIDIDFFNYYEKVKPLLGHKLINADMNEELLREVPHKRFINFAIVCYCEMPDEIVEKVGKGIILIRNEHLDIWGVESETVIEDAIHNMQETNPPELINMVDLLRELYDDPGQLICGKLPMWVLTSTTRRYGAGAILYNDWLEKVAEEVKEDYYILPSSIHEVIILPEKYASDKEYLVKMVREINEEQVDTEELLANNIYYYSRDTKKLQIFG